MDINSPAGFGLAIWLILQGRPNAFFCLLAPVCSSWVLTNTGTSQRSIAFAEGNSNLAYVRAANQMTSRTVLLAVLITALGGTFMIEQPGSSLMRYYFRMQWLFRQLPASWLFYYVGRFV
ncbi:unnamed protein product [Symbiodinium sp. CCMP2592]|nr:unnamed protein product [Symbiodinium sp. CCMP2592]